MAPRGVGRDRVLRVAAIVHTLGDSADFATLGQHVTRAELRAALDQGYLRRAGRGVYVSAHLDPARRAAAATRGVLSHTSAASAHGLDLWTPPSVVHVSVPRGTRPRTLPDTVMHWRSLKDDDLAPGGMMTSLPRTVIDCASTESFPDALAIADSALRSGRLDRETLLAAIPPRCPRLVRTVARCADPRAANAFESALRGVVHAAGFDRLVPQQAVDLGPFTAHLDLGDPLVKIAVEAEGFLYHSEYDAFARDLERYDLLAAAGWVVLRIAARQLRRDPKWVVDIVRRAYLQRINPERRHERAGTSHP